LVVGQISSIFEPPLSLLGGNGLKKSLRAKSIFARTFKLIWAVQSLPQKLFHFLFSEIVFTVARSAPTRGTYASSRTWSGNAVDAMVPTDERHFLRTAKSCGPGAPMQALSLREMMRERRWQSSRFTGEITYKL
jgi:hypothetical protein